MDKARISGPGGVWSGWTRQFIAAGLLCAALLWSFVAALDPFGLRVSPGRAAQPIMDINQRFMYPQLVRSGAFDAAIFGTSTMRLIDPANLSRALNDRFVNLGMNAATPWEQVQIAGLFARKVAAPRRIIWGIDTTWCESDATAPEKRLTPRPFPIWLYDDSGWTAWPRLLNLTTLEIAGRLLAHRLGLMPERIRGDGYEVFTPPEALYDLNRARSHLFASYGGSAPDLTPLIPPEAVSGAERAGWRFPALAWLDQALSAYPASTERLIVLPPVHLGALPREGSAGWQRYQACKAELAVMAARQGATILDYAHASQLTSTDANYWDPLHFRLAIAGRVGADIAAVLRGADAVPAADANVSRPRR
jgi:hypothetical protein